MGDEIEYRYDGVIVCEECGNEIQFRISGFEYPVGAYNYDDYEIYGGDFEKSPIVGIVYSQEEFDIDYAYNEFNRVERLILEISDKGYAWHTAIGLQAVDGLKVCRSGH